MPVCHASSIAFDGFDIAWFGPGGATWRVPVERLSVIGELTLDTQDERWFVAFVADAEGGWLQAPGHANGMSCVLARLGAHLNARLDVQLEAAAAGRSRVMWPAALLDCELFAFSPTRESRRLVHPTLHPRVLAYAAMNVAGRQGEA